MRAPRNTLVVSACAEGSLARIVSETTKEAQQIEQAISQRMPILQVSHDGFRMVSASIRSTPPAFPYWLIPYREDSTVARRNDKAQPHVPSRARPKWTTQERIRLADLPFGSRKR